MSASALKRIYAMFWPRACVQASPQLEEAAARYMATAEQTQRAALDVIDEAIGAPADYQGDLPAPLAKRIEDLTENIIEQMRKRDKKS